jgi:hypothetical protein
MSDDAKNRRRVGYKSPPEEHRFPKGKSGNPRGRPPKSVRAILPRQVRRDILDLCETETRVRTPQGDRTVSLFEAALLRLAQKALSGHGPSLRWIVDRYGQAVEEHLDDHKDFFAFVEMAERENVERPVPPENEQFSRRFLNDLRRTTRRY